MNNYYLQGFSDRCGQYGVSPEELVKSAGVVSEVLGGMIDAPLTGGLGHLGGSIAALATPTRTPEKQLEAEKRMLLNLVPGVGTYNMWKRMGGSRGWAEAAAGKNKPEKAPVKEEKEPKEKKE